MKKWLIALLGLLVIAGSAYGVRQSGVDLVVLSGLKPAEMTVKKTKDMAPAVPGRGSRGPSPVETAKVSPAQLSDDILAIGTLLADESVAIAPETSGRIAEILFRDGDQVKLGAALFRLDSDLANADLAEAKARLSLAEANYDRNQKLRKSGNIAQSTFDASQTEREVARTAVDSAEVHLKKLTITAPFPGTLGFRSISAGAYVTAGTVLVQLDKVDRLKVSFSVPELEQGRISVGQQVAVTADALPGENFTAVVSAIDPSVDVNGRSLKVRADLDNAELKLRPGLLVRILVKGNPREALLVPESAVVQRGDSAFVYLAQDNTAKETKVRLGKRMPGEIEIAGDVPLGADVIVAGNSGLRDGAAIEVVAAPGVVE